MEDKMERLRDYNRNFEMSLHGTKAWEGEWWAEEWEEGMAWLPGPHLRTDLWAGPSFALALCK
jgi:hypothetical protein